MIILGIESSCDDTSVALIEASNKGFSVLCEKTASQIEVHKKYGGVVPEIAGRKHAEQMLPVIETVLADQKKPDAIAVTSGPGLMTGLLVGVESAKALSYAWDIPLVPVNHIEGHIHSVLLQEQQTMQFPAVCLIVSGGHTELILMKDHGDYELIGRTRDDAAGECFDKVAKLLDFDYPGGPKISKLAATGDAKAIAFPRPMLDSDDCDFSFSGLKTAALYWLRDNKLAATDPLRRALRIFPALLSQYGLRASVSREDFCASFEQAIVDVLVEKTLRAIKQQAPKSLILGGGVSANTKLRESLEASVQIPVLLSPRKYAMDNGAMIAVAGYFHAKKKRFTDWKDIRANPVWKIYE